MLHQLHIIQASCGQKDSRREFGIFASSVLFFSRRRSEGWPHHGRTFSIYLRPLSFWLTLPRGVLSTSWCCPPRPCVVFLAFVHLALFLALSLSPDQSVLNFCSTATRSQPDMELGHWVTGSFGSSFTSGSPGHHFDPVLDPSFSGFRKNAQNEKRTFDMLKWQKPSSGVCCWTEITGCQSMQWTFTFIYDY